MNDKKFVDAIFIELFEKKLSQYKESLTKPVNNNKDSFARARNAIALLDDSQKLDVINFLKVVIADSVSVVLGTLDGVHFPDDLEGDFAVSFDGEEIQGDLQDIFIEKAQEAGAYD
ncbi:hypothetical protein [Pseudomonas inefficax]|uniref:hypothetical protein n=1 Tax=Pseudomonas inefficax TaxID=2078786 RepID=UPI004046D744